MNILKYNNENIFLERKNKIILTDYSKFYYFIKNLKQISNMELNGLKLNNKNTLVVDISSISSLADIFSDDNQIIDSYIKVKLDQLILEQDDEDILRNIIVKYLKETFGNYWNYNIELDYLKLLKSYSNLCIDNEETFYEMINCILNSNIFKEIIIIYKSNILNKFKLQNIEELNNENIILFELCDKESNLELQDNIIIFDKEITQIRIDDFLELIMKNHRFKDITEENCLFLLNRILFLAINKKEVDVMKKYSNEVLELVKVFEEEFKLNLTDVSDVQGNLIILQKYYKVT